MTSIRITLPHTPAEQPVLQATPMHNLSDFAVDSQADSAMDNPNLNSDLSQIASWPFKDILRIGVVLRCSHDDIVTNNLCNHPHPTVHYARLLSGNIVTYRPREKVRAGFVGIRQAARIGGWALGTLMVWGPAFNLAGIFNDA